MVSHIFYNTESALNNFCEYSMIDPAFLASCYGFTEQDRHYYTMPMTTAGT